MKSNFLPSITLSAICIIVAALLATINVFTSKKIQDNNDKMAAAAYQEVLPGASGLSDVAITKDIPSSIDLIKKTEDGSFIFRAVVTGKSSGMTVMIGINSEGLITGTKCISNSETPYYSAPVFDATESDDENKGNDVCR